MIKDKINRKNSKMILFFIIFLVIAFLMWCAPLCSDDYNFLGLRMKTNREFIHYALYYGNGRFLGNLGIIYLVKIKWLGVIIRALGITSICILVPYVLGCNDIKTYMLSTILVIGVPAALFSEVYTWASSFQNYIPPIWITLIILCLIQYSDQERQEKNIFEIFMIIIVFVLGVSSQLYIEHSTVVNNFISISVMLYLIKKRRNFSKILAIDWEIANIIGTILMVMIPKIFYTEENLVRGYRKINNNGAVDLINSCKMNGLVIAGKMHENFGVFIALAIISLTLLIIFRNKLEKKKNIILVCMYIIPIVYIEFNNLYLSKIVIYGHLNAFKLLLDVAALLLIAAATVMMMYNLGMKRELYLTIYLIVVIFFAVAPLFIVSLVPRRTLYESYISLVGIVLVNFEYLISRLTTNINKKISAILSIAMFSLAVFLSVIFVDIHKMDNERTRNIQNQLKDNEKVVRIRKIPNNYAYWDGVWMFRRYYYNKNYGDIPIEEIK